jgi:hypothetical protein
MLVHTEICNTKAFELSIPWTALETLSKPFSE